MAFSYSGNPEVSARDEIRFLIQDTDESCALLQDAEIDYILAKWIPLYGSVLFCASVAAGTISRKYAGVVPVSDGGTTVNLGDLQTKYAQMADELRSDYKREGDVGGLVNLENILLNNEYDPTIEPLAFAMKLDDNPRAGRQDWGGYTHVSDTLTDEALRW